MLIHPYNNKNCAHKIHKWKVLRMIVASNTSIGSKKVTDMACTTLGSGHHGHYKMEMITIE